MPRHISFVFPGQGSQFVGMLDNIDSSLIATIKEDLANHIGRLAVQCIKDTLEVFGFRCPVDGEYKVGGNWAETH